MSKITLTKQKYPNGYNLTTSSRYGIDSYDRIVTIGSKVVFNYQGELRIGKLQDVKVVSADIHPLMKIPAKQVSILMYVTHEDKEDKVSTIRNPSSLVAI